MAQGETPAAGGARSPEFFIRRPRAAGLGPGLLHVSRFGTREFIAAALVVAAVLFNFGLAFVNAHAMQLGRMHVVVAEMAIVGAALVVCLRFWTPAMLPWLGLFWLLVVLFLGLGFIRGSLDPKYVRDVALIPTFVMLGMTFARGNVIRVFFVIQLVVLAVMIFEGVAPERFGDVFNIAKYYIDTRGFQQADFWNESSNLFISATRPTDRFLFGSLGVHRLSSVFLEPVSLGNWAVVVVIATATMWRTISWPMRAFLLVSTFAVLVGCDGRFATVACAVILAGMLIFPRLPDRLPLVYLPGVVALGMVAVHVLGLQGGTDDFRGRIASSMDLLSTFTLGELFGIDLVRLDRAVDSGISYFILTQSIIGVTAIWLATCLLQPTGVRRTSVLVHGTCTYLSLVLLVSYSLFSIKTSAPLWFLYGYVRARTDAELAAAQRRRTTIRSSDSSSANVERAISASTAR